MSFALKSVGSLARSNVARTGSSMQIPLVGAQQQLQQKRFLNLHEHASMELMGQYGIPIPRGVVASTAEEAEDAYVSSLAGGEKADVVIKAQVLAGGRGMGTFTNGFQGGVHVVTRAGQAREFAEKMLGQRLVTKQTGAEGRPVSKVFLMERVYMRRELYLSIVMDRQSSGPVIVASAKGGTSIEEVAQQTPEAITKSFVDISKGVSDEEASRLADFLGLTGDSATKAANLIKRLYEMYIATDATLIEVNPLCETPDGEVLVCDAKINFDDNAAFRQPDIFSKRDSSQEDPREVEASQYDLNYIGLDGNIGCMVNGAGLAMATMDVIKLNGGNPANFLDVGGGATEMQVQKAFEILDNDKKVQTIFVNIFGGIMRCDVIAQGIVNAAKNIGLAKPLVCRLQGTNRKQAKELIENSGFRMFMIDEMDVAASKAVKMADIVKQAEEIDVGVRFELPI